VVEVLHRRRAYRFTSSTSFANPVVTVAQTLSNTFAGIAFTSVLPLLAIAAIRFLYPNVGEVAERVVGPPATRR
jgi:hypothetical protein